MKPDSVHRKKEAKGIMKKLTLTCLTMILGLFVTTQTPVYAADTTTDTTTAPTVTEAKMITDSDIELYWSEAVTGAGSNQSEDISNFSVTVDGKAAKIYQYTWEDYNYSEYGIVYYSPKNSYYPNNPDTPKTSIRLEEPVSDVNNLPEIKVTVKANKVKNSADVYAAEQTVDVNKYDAFYQKSITMDSGVTILGTAKVRDEAMTKAEEMLKVILANPSVAKRMGDAGCMLGLYGEGEIAYDIPEHRYSYDENYLYVEGFGGTQLASIKDANVLRLKQAASPDYYTGYPDESILTHEFAHTIQNYGLTEEQQEQWEQIYNNSVTKNGKWPGAAAGELSYAGSNSSEYFATLSAIWFNAMDDTWDGKWDGTRGPINTRRELKAYDKDAYDFLSTIYVSDQYLPSPWENGTVPDNYTWITFDANGGSTVKDERTIANGKTVGTLPGVTRSGYLLDGWYTEEEGGDKVTADTVAADLEGCRIYAHWTKLTPSQDTTNNNNGNINNGNSNTSNSGNNNADSNTTGNNTGSGVTDSGSQNTVSDHTQQTAITVGKAKFSSVKALSGKKISVKLRKVSGADGYKIQYSQNSKFKKSVKTKTITGTKVTLKNLKKGTWYIKVQAYKKDNTGKKIYGKISSVKKVKVKR